ncbi:MAG: DNA-directed RNA polymerase subunit alpha [Candidatus Aminicenantes bacterium]|nr:DNA-directed RNA polymerase subunit alpha [Candidatus Aminicenantes bacterium]
MTKIGFQRPRHLECDSESLTDSYGRFFAQPFERGYGITVGNSLRRILLSSIPGAAITNVRIQGVLHEFSTIPGVVEDVTDILLNLKSLRLKMNTAEPKVMTLKVKGPIDAKASDIEHDSDIEILNEDIHIASLDKDGKLDIEMRVENKRGYVPADQNYDKDLGVDFIPLDSSHSPVIKVNYEVNPARVGKRIDYEKLDLEVWTTGAMNPQDAVSNGAKILRDHLVIFMNVVDEPLVRDEKEEKEEIPYMNKLDILTKSIDHLELSVRSNNCLRSAGISYVYELVQKTEEELLKTKNFGRKSLLEIKETLKEMDLELNTEFEPALLDQIDETIESQEEEEEGEEEE